MSSLCKECGGELSEFPIGNCTTPHFPPPTQADREAAEAYLDKLYERPGQMELRDEEIEVFLAGIAHARKEQAALVKELVELLDQAISGNTRLVVPGNTWNERVKRVVEKHRARGSEGTP